MKSILSAFIAGCIFALGLIVSEMVNPKRVQGFLDVTNNWDPTLIFVMIGAIIVTVIGFKLTWLREKPLFENVFNVPQQSIIDRKLIVGAIIFGTGWGLSGLCPGPAIVSLATFKVEIIVFVVAMMIGMKGFDLSKFGK